MITPTVPKLDIARCNAEKKYAGTLRFGFCADGSLLDIPYVSFASPVEAELSYDILEDDSVEIRGTLSFVLQGACSRCLRQTQQRVSGEAEGYFVPGDGNGEDYSYRNGVIDLTEFLRDSLLFLLPARLVCSAPCVAPDYKED